jgi:hypothetical protein
MAEVLNLDTIMAEPREIVIKKPGRSNLLTRLFKRPVKNELIKITIPVPTFRQSQVLTQKYIEFVQKSLDFAQNPLASGETLPQLMMDFVITALKPGFPKVKKEWIEEYLTDDAFARYSSSLSNRYKKKSKKYCISDQLGSIMSFTEKPFT